MRNEYAGICMRCGRRVECGEGHFEYAGSKSVLHQEVRMRNSKWGLRCKGCVGKGHSKAGRVATLLVEWNIKKKPRSCKVLFEEVEGSWKVVGLTAHWTGFPRELSEFLYKGSDELKAFLNRRSTWHHTWL